MKIAEQYKSALSKWARYSEYTIATDRGRVTVRPAVSASVEMYDPMETAEKLMADVVNIGRVIATDSANPEPLIIELYKSYGPLGFLVELPFEDERTLDSLELHIKENPYNVCSSITLTAYLRYFFTEDFIPDGTDLAKETKRVETYNTIFSKSYGEPLSWIKTFCLRQYHFFEALRDGDEKKISLVSPSTLKVSYKVSLGKTATLQWVFPSLAALAEFTLANASTEAPFGVRACKHCGRMYYGANPRSEFCSVQCRNQFNVYKSRAKAKETE